MKLTFSHTRLLVQDYRACFRFYRDVLGFKVKWGDENTGYGEFQTGEVTIAVFDRKEMMTSIGKSDLLDKTDGHNPFVLIFSVDNVDITWKELRGRGVNFITDPTDRSDWKIRTAHFNDPDGNLIEINCLL